MVTDAKLLTHLHEIIRSSDLRTTTASAVCRRLEAELGADLSRRRVFIVVAIDKFLHRGNDDDATTKEGQRQRVEVVRNDDVRKDLERGRCEEERGGEKIVVVRNKSAKTTDSQSKNGFQRPCALSPQLQKLFGVSELPRTEVVKKLWEYIKAHDLQNPSDRRIIICDNALYSIFRVRKINMFDMSKELTRHISSLNESKAKCEKPSAKSSQSKEKMQQASPPKSSRKEDLQKIRRQLDRLEKNEKGVTKGGLMQRVPISDKLIDFIGTGERKLSRTETTKRLWKYIKDNNLQEPCDKWKVICDKKLKQLLGVDTFHGLDLTKLLNRHFVKN